MIKENQECRLMKCSVGIENAALSQETTAKFSMAAPSRSNMFWTLLFNFLEGVHQKPVYIPLHKSIAEYFIKYAI